MTRRNMLRKIDLPGTQLFGKLQCRIVNYLMFHASLQTTGNVHLGFARAKLLYNLTANHELCKFQRTNSTGHSVSDMDNV